MSRVNFPAVKAAAHNRIEELVTRWLPNGKREGSEWVALNPTRDDSAYGSFKVNLGTGYWSDFATGDNGGDLISLYAYLNNCSQLDAARALMDQLGIGDGQQAPPTPAGQTAGPAQPAAPAASEWTPIRPVPDDAPAPPESHYRHGKPSKRWAYRDDQGRLLFYVYRFDPKKKGSRKQIQPVTFCQKDEQRQWRWKALPEPRPLYNLDQLAAKPDAPVLVCEGEKAADAAAQLFPDCVTTTSPNGSRSVKKADWSVLAGRRVIVWPDFDIAGKEYAADVAKMLKGQAAELLQVHLPFAGTPQPGGGIDPASREPGEGWDAADAVEEGWTADHIAKLRDDPNFFQPLYRVAKGRGGHGTLILPEQLHKPGEQKKGISEGEETWPAIIGGWVVTNDGVQEPGHNGQPGGMITLRPIWVDSCTFQIIGNRHTWGVFIKFYDLAWRLRTHAFPMRRLSEQGGVLGQELLDMGLPVIAGKEKMLSRFLGVQAQAAPHTRATSKLGWLDDDVEGPRVFVMPDKVIGDAEEIIYQPDAPNMEYLAATLHAHGTIDEWRDKVAKPCANNPVLMFALALGFAPPLMRFIDCPSGGFHLAGGSTTGKTTALQVAVTPWGCGADPQSGPQHTAIRRWKATGNALEAVAEMHNHMLLALDEINEVDPRELGGIIYQLAGGQSKGRSTMHGGLRAPRHWQLLYISSGERSVIDILRMGGHTLQGGQQVRLPEIPAEDPQSGKPAIIEDPHGADPRAFAESLKHACARCYGTAGPTFVVYLIQQVQSRGQHQFVGLLRQELQQIQDTLAARVEKAGERLTDENRRALRQFALVILAGAHAKAAGILPWDITEMYAAGESVVLRWVRDQGEERTEVERGLSYLRDRLIANAENFRAWDDAPPKGGYRELVGFKKDNCYLLTPTGLANMLENYDVKQILQALAKKGYLETNKGRLTKRAPLISALGSARPNMYWIKESFLNAEDDGSPAVSAPPPKPVNDRLALDDDDDIPY